MDGWSIPVIAAQATIGDWRNARDAVLQIPAAAFTSSGRDSYFLNIIFAICIRICLNFIIGGDGHSLTNTLWWIGTRPTG
jgi:hypothetical protein